MRVVVVGMAYAVVTLPVDTFPVEYRAVRDVPISASVGGSGFTAARTLAALGDEVYLAAPLGEDAEGVAVDVAAYRYGVNSAMCPRSLPRSPRAVVLECDGQRQISRDLGEAPTAHVDLDLGALATSELVIVDGVLPTAALISSAQATGVPVAAALGTVREPPLLEQQPYLAAELLVMSHDGRDEEHLVRTWRRRSAARLVVVTLGERGAVGMVPHSEEVIHVPARHLGGGLRPAGVGATYAATLAHYVFARGCDARGAMEYAATAAAWTIAHPGEPDGLREDVLEAAAARPDEAAQAS
ncbi:carbohydrate kinase family protein [Oceanitalea stevensii]|uniref:Carbohydrate kinase family protein n=1 Tax=Oceanitalea stevensii TaxID=2763072 RepID=A0ABR8Z191_9MICO|nr:carbohydrate kinase family protein [Oceanitalea stevensii]MBD8062089.1 carbohydrate kinase family protein [Oceanitalea stevensii]